MATDPDALMRLFGDDGVVVQVTERSAAWEGGAPTNTAKTKVVLVDKKNRERVRHYLWKVGEQWFHACRHGIDIPTNGSLKPYIKMLKSPFREFETPSDLPTHLYEPAIVQCMLLGTADVQPNMSHVLDFCKTVSVRCADLIQRGLQTDHEETVGRYLDYEVGLTSFPQPHVAPSETPHTPQQVSKRSSESVNTAPARLMEEFTDAAHDAFTRFSTGEVLIPWTFSDNIVVAVGADGITTTTVTNATMKCVLTVKNVPEWFRGYIPVEKVNIPDISELEDNRFSVNVVDLPEQHLDELRRITVKAEITVVAPSPFPSPGGGGGGGTPGGTPSPGGGGGGGGLGGGDVLPRVVLERNGIGWQILLDESDENAVAQLLATSTTIKDILRIQ